MKQIIIKIIMHCKTELPSTISIFNFAWSHRAILHSSAFFNDFINHSLTSFHYSSTDTTAIPKL